MLLFLPCKPNSHIPQAGRSRFYLWLGPALLFSASCPPFCKRYPGRVDRSHLESESSCALGRRDRTRIPQGLTLTLRPLRWVIYSLLKCIKIASFSNCCSCHQPPVLSGTALTRGWLPRWHDINIPSRQGGFHPEGRGYLEHLAKTRRGSTS